MDEGSMCIPGLVSANEAVVLERLVPSRRAAADGDEPALAGMALALRLPHRLLLFDLALASRRLNDDRAYICIYIATRVLCMMMIFMKKKGWTREQVY